MAARCHALLHLPVILDQAEAVSNTQLLQFAPDLLCYLQTARRYTHLTH